jgi:hypothetical protein
MLMTHRTLFKHNVGICPKGEVDVDHPCAVISGDYDNCDLSGDIVLTLHDLEDIIELLKETC